MESSITVEFGQSLYLLAAAADFLQKKRTYLSVVLIIQDLKKNVNKDCLKNDIGKFQFMKDN
ncbi:hypothetical protein D3846_04645 [Streptococcus mutans]|uniref:Uncharacterized protein n=1 Tax=Streptococcus mutans SM6 TaxID=857119 RepID=A0A829BQD7_STRMG|nr:hypothetical protein SMU68_10108 [Streptococcus mutans NFSM1]EMC23502.1 hypothetical protein SMU82_06719 [Streptococcus mutans SM6]EMC51928.1 hypothetical protein SMU102_01741 [Streptococcus mutans S1B]NLQ37022.1 hypothetical protein [Streptococcus mutans]NLQ64878.1 hypothetical protein [Streptococcus mutans]